VKTVNVVKNSWLPSLRSAAIISIIFIIQVLLQIGGKEGGKAAELRLHKLHSAETVNKGSSVSVSLILIYFHCGLLLHLLQRQRPTKNKYVLEKDLQCRKTLILYANEKHNCKNTFTTN
jgi:preprotein translocase subunit SecG